MYFTIKLDFFHIKKILDAYISFYSFSFESIKLEIDFQNLSKFKLSIKQCKMTELKEFR